MSISKIFIPNFVFSQMKVIQNISDMIFILSPGTCTRGGTLGHWGCPGGSVSHSLKKGQGAGQKMALLMREIHPKGHFC